MAVTEVRAGASIMIKVFPAQSRRRFGLPLCFHGPWHRRGACWLLVGLLAGSIAEIAKGADAAFGANSPGHILQVHDPALTAQLLATGGRLVADYGSSQLLEVTGPPDALQSEKAELRDEYRLILLHAAHLDVKRPELQALRKPVGNFSGKHLHLVHLAGPILPQWRRSLEAAGVQIVTYIPQNTYLVYGDAHALAQVQGMADAAHIDWDGPLVAEYKIHPTARPLDRQGKPRPIGTDQFAVQLLRDPDANTGTLLLLDRLKLAPITRQQPMLRYLNVVVRLSPADLATVAAQPDVVSIQPYFPRRRFCERQDQILAGNLNGNVPAGPGYLAWLATKGFTQAQFDASGFVVDLSDSGIDQGTTSPNHPALHKTGNAANPSRVAYSRLEGTPNTGSTLVGCDGHGTLNAHILCGYDNSTGFPHTDSTGFHYGLGVCPFVQVGASVIFDPDFFTNPSYDNLQSDAYASGARISNNSWGSPGNGAYDIDAQNYDALVRDAQPAWASHPADGNQEMVIVFSAGNDGPSIVSVGSPATAKNIISVGGAESVQAFGGPDGSAIPDSQANSANDIPSFSSRGPCGDGRHKPDLLAPSTHVSGGAPEAANPGPTGTAEPCFISSNGSGVSGGPNNDLFWPAGQELFTASSGTSHAAPAVSGGCALVRQYFINQFSNPPGAAMTKAWLLNSTRYLTGSNANDTLWSDNQGMGEMDLAIAFDGVPRVLRDEIPADLFTASGQTRVFTGTISDPTKPFRVTLAWTDAPGNTVGNAYNNDLNLTVAAGGSTYKGNVFAGAYSTTGGTADMRNNVESVFLPAGTSGHYVVTVTAANINSDGVPGNAYPLDQDFALVIYNAAATVAPVLNTAGTTLLAETCSPPNGAIDPGETVTMSFALQNIGTAPTTNLVATLLPGAGLAAPSGPQSYGALVPGGPAVTQPFAFTALGSCGSTVAATLQLQDGTNQLDPVTFNLTLGQGSPFTAFVQNFDSVSQPALPAGWTTDALGAGSTWTTTSATFDTSPYSASVPDVPDAGVGELVSPIIPIHSASAQLSFMQYFITEADTSAGLGYDGGVLEIKIGSAPFTDILAAGGSFVTGGYTLGLDPTTDNPLGPRQAWSGESPGFISTVVNLPPAAANQNIQLKWRLGTDTGNASSAQGWWIDSVSLQDVAYACCTNTTPPTITGISFSGTSVTIRVSSLSGHQYTLQYKNALNDPGWQTLSPSVPGTGGVITLTDMNPTPPTRFYRVAVN